MELPPDHIRVVNVRPAVAASTSRGLTDAELARLGLPADVLSDRDGAVSGAATYAHMARMAVEPDLDGFLVDAADAYEVGSLGVVGLACKTMPDVGEALRCHQRFQHLTNRTARYTSTVRGDGLWLVEERWGPPRPGRRLLSEYTLMVAVRLLALAIDGPVPVLAATTPRERSPEHAAIEAYLGAGLQPGEAAAICLPLDWLSTPVATADPELAAYFHDVLARAAPAPEDEGLLTRVRGAIQALLPGGPPTCRAVARHLGTSQRTLQRRLAEHGQSFAALHDETRHQLALGYLDDPELGIAEVAWLVGYQRETSFFRAFRRWTGTTPTAWRSR